jgi:HlyD family secretion protein
MNPAMYRKVALDRLASPDDLDRMLTITSARQWLILAGLLGFVSTVLVWSFVARVPTKASGVGLVIGEGGVVNIVTTGTGIITNFKLKIGDNVHAGEVVATIAQPEIVVAIQQANNRLAEARVDAAQSLHVQGESTRLQIAALDRQRATIESDIKQDESLVKLDRDQIPVEQKLVDDGLSTKQQLIAAQQKLVQVQADEDRSKALLVGVDAQRYALESQPASNRRDALSRIDELERQLQMLQQQLQNSTRVVSPFNGEVVELKVYEGATAVAGTPVLSLQPDIRQLEVVAFVPTEVAKSVFPGMAAQVSPSTVKREEYGYMRGKVTYVSDFPTTTEAAMRTFENDSLVSAFKSGVVNEVRVSLTTSSNASGYEWSSVKSPKHAITSGTLCSLEIITEERPPIELVMPFLKAFLNTN